ncbi:MAG: protein kinase [Woeseiaceae bacterium]|nr:protein kinase [Woeseiaceae bacterium]
MPDLTKGTRLAERYTLERQLGRGGEAETWLARDRMTSARVALKVVSASASKTARLRDEWQANLRLMHAHILRVFEFHEDKDLAFYSMQHVDGPDLGALSGASLEDILRPIGLIVDALRYVHGKGVVHRDLKAANVLLDYNGAPYLSDFGVAVADGGRRAGGSLIASSPQVLAGAPASPADDVFALGCLIYELVSGRAPWPPGATAEDIHATTPAPLFAASGEDVPAAVRDIVASMLSMAEDERPPMQSVADGLRAAGFTPGIARNIKAARPVAEDERIETVAAVRRPAAEAADPIAVATASSGLNPRLVGASLAVLVALLLGVVFLLPDAVDEKETPSATNRMEPTAEGAIPAPASENPVSADTVEDDPLGGNRVTREYVPENTGLEGEIIEFNENEADYSGLDEDGKLRFNVESILGELLSDFETLERRSVQRWAPVQYRRAQEFYKSGDEAYLRKDYAAAEVHYLDALTVLEPLFERVEPEFEKALAGAKVAFDAGDRTEALRLYELAVAITPNHPEAREGLERARNLEAVLRLVDQGLEYEEQLELDAAETSFAQALDLDANWLPAAEGLERVRETRTKIRFDSRMSEGLEALADGDYLSARAAFRMAQQLIPGSPEPADGLMQVDQGLRLSSIATLEQEALSLEKSEHWDAAATTYEGILEVDANLSFAIDGLTRARQMSALHKRLDDYIDDPDRLSIPGVMQQATMLVVEVTRMPDIGPRLAGQRDELSRLLKRAATPVRVELVSDNQTSVTIYKVGMLGNFATTALDLRPGTYVAVGSRAGFRDVRQEFRVAPEIDMQPVVIRCEEPI